jgi:hypothetical protein
VAEKRRNERDADDGAVAAVEEAITTEHGMAVEPEADDGAVAAAEEAATTDDDLDMVDAAADDVAENPYTMRWFPGAMLCGLIADEAERQSGGAPDRRD